MKVSQRWWLVIGGRKLYVIVDGAKNGKEDPPGSLCRENVVLAAHHRQVRANHPRCLRASGKSVEAQHRQALGGGSRMCLLQLYAQHMLIHEAQERIGASIVRLLNKEARSMYRGCRSPRNVVHKHPEWEHTPWKCTPIGTSMPRSHELLQSVACLFF